MQRHRRSHLPVTASLLTGGMLLALALLSPTAPSEAQQPVSGDAAAPELVGGPWLNTPQNAPIRLASRHGKVTLVEFWTFD